MGLVYLKPWHEEVSSLARGLQFNHKPSTVSTQSHPAPAWATCCLLLVVLCRESNWSSDTYQVAHSGEAVEDDSPVTSGDVVERSLDHSSSNDERNC